jgi:ribA/ribD-fused uncharacterized protein
MAFGGEIVPNSIYYRGRATDPTVRYLSNWQRLNHPIEFRGKTFWTTEHLYKWAKAKFFADNVAATQILSTDEPNQLSNLCTYRGPQHTALNRKWDRLKEQIMIAITEMKFGSDNHFLQHILATGNQTLIEDTNDERWGRGRNGTGHNLHGKCLMIVREMYRNPNRANSPDTYLVGDSLVRDIELPGCITICMGGAHSGQVCLIGELFSKLGVTELILHVGTNDCFPRPSLCPLC